MEETFLNSSARSANLQSVLESRPDIANDVAQALHALKVDRSKDAESLASLYRIDHPTENIHSTTTWDVLPVEQGFAFNEFINNEASASAANEPSSARRRVRIINNLVIDGLEFRTQVGLTMEERNAKHPINVRIQFEEDNDDGKKLDYAQIVKGLYKVRIAMNKEVRLNSYIPAARCWKAMLTTWR